MTIDILLSTYNGASFIDAQLESLFNQTYKDFKLLIRDDGSKDETPQKLLEWKSRFPDRIELTMEENVGVIESFNRLAERSKAPYSAFCDQDDVWLPEKLEKCFKLMEGKKGPSLVHSDLEVVDKNLQRMDASFWHYSRLSGEDKYTTLGRLLVQNVVTGCTTLINSPLKELAFPVPKEALMHDWWLVLAASCFGKIYVCKEALILYRQHGNNTLGAKPFTIIKDPRTSFKRVVKAAKDDKRKVEQAKAFLERYKGRLNLPTITLLEDFTSLFTYGRYQRLRKIIKHGFYKIGWERNLIYLMERPYTTILNSLPGQSD